MLPDVHEHVMKLGLPISMMTLPWFLCLSVGYVPFELSLRILDVFFCKGANGLFCIYLALLETKAKTILKLSDAELFTSVLKQYDYDCDELFEVIVQLCTVYTARPRTRFTRNTLQVSLKD